MADSTDAAVTSPDARTLPPVADLSGEQAAGRSCVYCNTPITHGGYPAGISRGHVGARVVDTQVYAGPCCPQETP